MCGELGWKAATGEGGEEGRVLLSGDASWFENDLISDEAAWSLGSRGDAPKMSQTEGRVEFSSN